MAVGEILDSAERQARACVRTWKDGVYQGEAILDDDGHGITDISIRATVTKLEDSLTIDLTDSHPQVIGFVNSSYPNTMSAIHMAFAYLIDPRIPKNEGTFRAAAPCSSSKEPWSGPSLRLPSPCPPITVHRRSPKR